MLSVSHAATGALIATKVGNPLLAVPLILASHYAEDAVAHWDVGTGLSKGLKSPATAFRGEIVDLVLAGIIVLVMFPLPLRSTVYNLQSLAPIWGAFFGLLPDFLEAPRNFLRCEPRWLKPINAFHARFHHSIPRVAAGLAPQILLLGLIWFLR